MRLSFIIVVSLSCLAGVRGQGKSDFVKITSADVEALKAEGAAEEAASKKKWEGKTGEVVSERLNSRQEQKTGEHAGEVLFSCTIADGDKKTLIPFYMKNAADIAKLRARQPGDKSEFRIRGTIHLDYAPNRFRIVLEDARLVGK